MGGKLQNGIMEGMRQAGNGLQEGLKEGMNSAQREWREVSKYRLEKNRSDIPYELRQRSYTGISGGCLEADTAGETAAGHLCTDPPGKITGTILAITGYSLTGVFALSTIVTGIVTAIYPVYRQSLQPPPWEALQRQVSEWESPEL